MTALQRNEFQRLLFRTAFCVMACDGHIDQKEIDEIKKMEQSSAYFTGIDLSDELNELLDDLKEKGKHIIDELLSDMEMLELSTIQELLMLEVSLRIVNADNKEDENEIKFIKLLRSKLKVYNEFIRERFGLIEYLFDKDYSKDAIKKDTHRDFFDTIAIPEHKEIIYQITFRK